MGSEMCIRDRNEEDISSAVFHLYKNEYITGQILRVDGGRSLN